MLPHLLLQTLQRYADFPAQEFPAFLELFCPFHLARGEHFYRAGEIPRWSPFVMRGCLRKYFVDEAGDEQIVYFAEEGWFAGEVGAMRSRTPTQMFLQATEDCELLGISMEDADAAMARFPGYRAFFLSKYGQDHIRLIEEATRIKRESLEALYAWLLETRPQLVLRVPQRYLANYLGIRPETLSRLRAKRAAGRIS